MKKLTRGNHKKFWENVEVGKNYTYSQSFLWADVEKAADVHEVEVAYNRSDTNEWEYRTYGCFSFRVIGIPKNKWTQKWPDKVGRFWFYGYRYGRISVGNKCNPEYIFVKNRKIANGFLAIGDGQMIAPSEVEEAWWLETDVPDPPKNFKE